jgi:hypothetical protein
MSEYIGEKLGKKPKDARTLLICLRFFLRIYNGVKSLFFGRRKYATVAFGLVFVSWYFY